MFDVSKQSEQLTEGVVDLNVRMEFSANVPVNTQALIISDIVIVDDEKELDQAQTVTVFIIDRYSKFSGEVRKILTSLSDKGLCVLRLNMQVHRIQGEAHTQLLLLYS